MNSKILANRRLMRYLTPVIVLSIIYNINKFFEAELIWEKKDCGMLQDTTAGLENGPQIPLDQHQPANLSCTYEPSVIPTKLRMKNAQYNTFVHYARCIILGISPVAIIVYLNTKIYRDIQARRSRDVPISSHESKSFERLHGEGQTIGKSEAQHDGSPPMETAANPRLPPTAFKISFANQEKNKER